MTTHSSSNTTKSNSSNNETDSLFSSSLVIVTSILGHCHFTDLFNAQLVNRSWCRYANSRGVWEVMIIKKLYNIDFNQYTPLYSPIIINGRYQLQPIQETQYKYDLFNATPQQLNEIVEESNEFNDLDAISYFNKNLTNQTYLKSLFQYLFPHDYSLHQSLQFVQSLIPIMFNSNNDIQQQQQDKKDKVEDENNNNNSDDQDEDDYFVNNYNHKNIDSSYLDSKFGYISRKVTCPLGVIENDILGHIKKSIRYGECKLIDGKDTELMRKPPPNINGYIFIPQEDQSFTNGSWDGTINGNVDSKLRIVKQIILVPSSSSLNNNQSIDNNNYIQYYKTIQITQVISTSSYPALGHPNISYNGDSITYIRIQLIDHSKEGEEIHLKKITPFTLINCSKTDKGDDEVCIINRGDDEDEGESIYHDELNVNIRLKKINQIMEFINLPQSKSKDIKSMVEFLLPSDFRNRKLVVDCNSRYHFNPIMISYAKQLKYKIRLLEEINTRNEFKNNLELKNKLITLVQQMYDMKKWKNSYEQDDYQPTLNWWFRVKFTVPYDGDGKLRISISISLTDPEPVIECDYGDVHIDNHININSIYNGTKLEVFNEEKEIYYEPRFKGKKGRYSGRTGTNLQDNLNQAFRDKYPHFPIDMVTLLKLFKVDNHIKLEYGKANNLIYPVMYKHNSRILEQHLKYVMNDPIVCFNLASEDDNNDDHSKYTPLFTHPDDISDDDEDDDSNNNDDDSEVKSNQEADTTEKEKSDLKRVNEDQGEDKITKYQKHDNQ